MKKLLLVIGIITATNVLMAQEDTSIEERQEEVRQKIKERLELTDEQEAQLKELRQKYSKELKSIRMDEEKTRSEKLHAAAEVVENRENELSTILTTQQITEMKTMRKNMRQRKMMQRKRRAKRWSTN